jgi:hypothetical protein
MSLKNYRGAIIARNEKVREMESRYEPPERVRKFKEESLNKILTEYKDAVRKNIDGERKLLNDIKSGYEKSQPSVAERAQELTLLKNKVRALTDAQLKKAAEQERALPLPVQDATTLRTLASELRDRKLVKDADTVSEWIEHAKADTPYVHSDEYKHIEKRIKRFETFEAQATENGLLITSDDPDEITESDVIPLSKVDQI